MLTASAWLALGAAVALVPLPSIAGRRAAGLVRRGRLSPAAARTRRRLPTGVRPATVGLVCCTICAGVAGLLGGVALGISAAVLAATVAALASSALARRRDAHRRRGLLTAVRLLVAELEAGSRPASALSAAMAVAADYASVFAAAANAAEGAGDVADVLLTSGAADLGPLAHAWRLGALTGAPMADVLARVAADLADHERQRLAVAVALAGPRSSGALLAALPLIGITLGAAMGARPLAFLLGAPGGRALCCVGVLLDAAGLFWTQRLLQKAQRA